MLDELMGQVAGRFPRVEPRRRARAFVLGLLAGLPRVNCWSIAEHAGDATPGGMQHLLSRASWDAGGVRDDLRRYIAGQLGDPGAVLVVDETGDLKKRTCTAGVARQYTGTAGRTENAQVGVYLTYAAPGGHAPIDRELYLPACWISDPGRCRAAGIPAGTTFATCSPATECRTRLTAPTRRRVGRHWTWPASMPARGAAPSSSCGTGGCWWTHRTRR